MTLQSAPNAEEKVIPRNVATPATSSRNPDRTWAGDILAIGFAITVAIWATAYISRLPMVAMPGQVTIAGMLTIILLGGFLAARYSTKGLYAALWAGLLSGLLDLIVISSVFHDLQSTDLTYAPSATLWIAGSVLLNILVAGIGGLIGRLMPSQKRSNIHWSSVLAFVLTAATFLMIAAGGLVTAFHAGLAVPDWPQSFGYNMFLFPLSIMQKDSGKFFEHAHRLMGTLVGLTSIAVAINVTMVEWSARRTSKTRWSLILLVWAVFIGVGIQGVLGGLRVTNKSETLAIIHGAFAQVVFAMMALIVAATCGAFRRAQSQPHRSASVDRIHTVALLIMLTLQLILGTILRHTNQMLMIHITMAALVTFLVAACGIRAWGLHGKLRPLLLSGIAILVIVALQITLGVLALTFWKGTTADPTIPSALLTTAHQINGALLLATASTLTLWTWRLLSPQTKQVDRI